MSPVPDVLPRDEHNRTLIENVHPPDWRNPEPTGRYNLVVLGAGTGGLVTAAIAASLGARVALVERHLLGGDCLNVGCVPSKAVIRSSRLAAEARAAGAIGLAPAPEAKPDFPAAMERMRAIRARIAPHDSADRFRDLGVDVFLGPGHFVAPDALEVEGRRLRFRRAVIATGARAAAPPIPGLDEAGHLTNETVFSLTADPGRLAVIGGGPIGCELAQAFARLGSRVTLFQKHDQVLEREDGDAAAIVQRALLRDGVRLELGARLDKVRRGGSGKEIHFADSAGAARVEEFDEILVAAGRAPNVEGIGLEEAGVRYDPRRGVEVDDRLRTANPRIYAVGDCCMRWKFTHAADAAAKIAVQNALFFGRKKLGSLVVPWCTYTDPEIAHVGLSAHEAREQGVEIDTYSVALSEVDRAVCDGEEEGFVRVHVRKGSDRIVGGTIVASHAGDLIAPITLSMVKGLGLGTLSGVIFPYPTQAEGLKATANAYTRTRLTPRVRGLFERFFRWMR